MQATESRTVVVCRSVATGEAGKPLDVTLLECVSGQMIIDNHRCLRNDSHR